MGTTYHISHGTSMRNFDQSEIDSILIAINQSVSTYIDSSTISKINNSETHGKATELIMNGDYVTSHKVVLPTDPHFIENFKASERVYLDSDGAFDPTVMPLVNYWGFGYTPKNPVTDVDSQKVSQILESIGFSKINLGYNENEMVIIKPGPSSLDFSAIAKGYACLLYTSPSPRDGLLSRMPSSA